MDLGLTDRVFVLTGASRGLGFATAECLVAEGAKVVVSSRDPEHVVLAVKSLGGENHAAGLAVDLGDADAPGRLVELARHTFGRLDGALISVGGPPQAPASQVSDDQWRESFETVFLGTVRSARTVADALHHGGAVAVVLSTSVRTPVAGLGISNGLRPGLAGVVKDMADHYADRHVRFVSLLPGRIMTDRNKQLLAASGDPVAAAADVASSIPLGRFGEPAEFGRVATFVLSPAASYLTGISIPVDGGALRCL